MAGGSLKPTIEDVARAAGVSQTTVSYVLSRSKHSERISPETKDRILSAAKTLGYNRNPIGAALQRGYSDTIVLLAVTWELAQGHTTTMVTANRAASELGLATIVHVAGDDAEAITFLRKLPAMHPYGLLLLWDSDALREQHLQNLNLLGLPIVDLMPSSVPGTVSITFDREDGTYKATEHLIKLGHRKIGMILDTHSRWRTSNQKLAGYQRALFNAKIEFDKNLLEEVTSFGFEAGENGLKSLLKRNQDVTAVVCINDPMALGAVSAARDLGLDVPGNLSVIGFGDARESEYFHPKLTTVAMPPKKTATDAVETLVKMRREPDFKPQSKCEPMQLVVRESTGPARQK